MKRELPLENFLLWYESDAEIFWLCEKISVNRGFYDKMR